MKILKPILTILLITGSFVCSAQWEEDTIPKQRYGFIANFDFTYDLPFGDMGDRFGQFFTLGGGVMYKTPKNMYYQVFSEFLMSDNVKQNDMYSNVGVSPLELYDFNGDLKVIDLTLRGLNIGAGVGKTVSISKKSDKDNGILFMTSLSFLQHRINYFDRDGVMPQASGDYAKGYDYLSNGICVNQSINYVYFSKNTFTNFSAGINFRFGYTKNRRSYNFYSGVPIQDYRSDFSVGFQFRWLIPLFSSLDKDIYF